MSYATSYIEVRDSIDCIKTFYQESAIFLIKSINWKENEKILDYGCGSGDFARKYLFRIAEQHKSKVYGIDIDEKSIATAKTDSVHDCIEYFVGDILSKVQDFPFEKQEMDKIIGVFVLPYITDTRMLYKPLFDLLKPGGQIGLIYAVGKFYKIAADVANLEKWKEITQEANVPWAEWMFKDESETVGQRKMLSSCGFVNTVDTAKEYTLKFETLDQLFEFLATVHNGLSQIPWDSRSENFDWNVKEELWEDLLFATQNVFPAVDLNAKPVVLETVVAHRIVSEKPTE